MKLQVFALLHAAWLIAFGIELWGVSRAWRALNLASERLQSANTSLQADYREARDLVKQSEAKTKDLEYLHSLVNIIPQDKSYIRTQKVISDEVQSLRKVVGRRLGERLHIVVDTKANKLYFKKGLTLLWQADCSVGRGGILVDKRTGRRWEFVTPRGEFRVLGKIKDPVWTKPDWAFTESGEPVPPPDDPARKVPGELGAYVLNLGDGYLIHGTKNEEALGSPASHGCVRLGAEPLDKLYQAAPAGTRVYIY